MKIDTGEKVKTLTELCKILLAYKVAGKQIVTTNGAFDILHTGHVSLLESSAALGDILVVLVNSDESIKRYKGSNRPVLPLKDRARMLAALECVDFVCAFQEDTPTETLQMIAPAIHTKGSDYDLNNLPERHVIESFGGKVVILELVLNGKGKISTSEIIKNLSE